MKKIRILALLLAILMIPCSALVACKDDTDTDNECADGHTWNKKETTIEKRTCTESGIKERTCKVCGVKEQYEWKPDGHTISKAEWVFNEDATCTQDGTETRTCALCTYSETRIKEGTALGHNFLSYVRSEDGYSETAPCDRCSAVTDTRLVGMKVDFEGERDSLSYSAFHIYTVEGVMGLRNTDIKTEGDEGALNSYLRIERTADIQIGDNGYGVLLKPGYSTLKSNLYVVEYDIKINETETKDLTLLAGIKEETTVDFLTYDSLSHVISTAYGEIYTLKAPDYDRWMKISVVLNDVEKRYDLYIDSKLVLSNIDYCDEEYYVGSELENFKIGMTHKVGEASAFDIDNIDIYNAFSPKGYTGTAFDADYAVFETTHNKNKIMYKKLADGCEHTYGDTVTVKANCYCDGYTYKECSKCHGRTELATDVEKTGHSMTVNAGHKDATCTEYGADYLKCEYCEHKEKTVIAKRAHEVDTEAASYRNVPATCISDGYISGECKECHCEMNYFNGEYKFGHDLKDITVVKEADCVNAGYSTGVCANCGETQTVNEIPALGHSMKSVIKTNDTTKEKVIETYCTRCNLDTYKTEQKLYTDGEAYPTLAEMTTALGSNLYAGVDGTGFTTSQFDVGGSKLTSMRFTNDGSSSSAAQKNENGGKNQYLKITHTGTGYLNYLDSTRHANADIVIELSLRLPKDESKIPTGTMSAAQRIIGHNVVFNVFKLQSDGSILFIPGNCVIGTLSSDRFIKLSFVIKPGSGLCDAYFDGQLKAQNCLMKSGDMSFVPDGGVVYEYRFLLNNTTEKAPKELDVDDMFYYEASIPVYVTEPSLSDSAEVNYDVSQNTVGPNGDYIKNNKSGIIGNNVTITSGANFRAYAEIITLNDAEISALHCLRGTDVQSIYSHIKSEIVTSTTLMKNPYAVIRNEILFNAGSFTGGNMNSGTIVLAQGRKQLTSGAATVMQDMLVLRDGKIYTGDGKAIYTVKQGEWIKYEVVVSELDGRYDVYINGRCRASGVECDGAYVSEKYSTLGYSFMSVEDGTFDFYMANTALYAGANAPVSDITVGKTEDISVTTTVTEKADSVTFNENQSIESFYDYVGKLVYDSVSDKLVPLTSGAKKGALGIYKNGDKTYLKASDFKTNALNGITFKYLMNTRLTDTEDGSLVYDLSNYDYLTVTLNVESLTEGGYNVIFKLNAKDGGYYAVCYRITRTGEQTFKIPLRANTEEGKENTPYFKNNGATGDLKDIVSISIGFSGETVGNGVDNNKKIGAGNGNGALMDGTSILFEKIGFENDSVTTTKEVGTNIDSGTFCKNNAHSYTSEVVDPTCTSKGYTKKTCSVCGHIAVSEIKDPVKPVKSAVAADHKVISVKSCETDGVEIDKFTCSSCGDSYSVITKVELAEGHKVTEGTCTVCGKKLEGYIDNTEGGDEAGTEGGAPATGDGEGTGSDEGETPATGDGDE